MSWHTRGLLKVYVTITVAGLLLLVLMIWVPVSAAGADERVSGLAMPRTGTVQTTPTVDSTMVALQKEQLTLQNDKLKNDNSWAWLSPVSTIFGPLATIGTILVGILVARNNFLQWSKNREDEQKRREDDQRIEREKRAEDQRVEREKRDEERFQKVVEGLGSERMEAKLGAAITLRTFLQPGYERFYGQAFDLAVAHLRLRKAEVSAPGPLTRLRSLLRRSSATPTASIPLDSLSQALVIVFKESFPRARNELKKTNAQFDPQLLDATDVRLDHAYLVGADLAQAWLVGASLREADLSSAQLKGAHLFRAQLDGALLYQTQLEEADLGGVQLKGAHLWDAHLEGARLFLAQLDGADLIGSQLDGADLEGARLDGAHLEGAHLTKANPEAAYSLQNTKMNGATGLTTEQREACIKKGAIFDDAEQVPASDTSHPFHLHQSKAMTNSPHRFHLLK